MATKIPFLFMRPKQNMIDGIPLKVQYLLFSGLMKIFENYPQSLFSFCEKNNLKQTDLTKDMPIIPYWYAQSTCPFNKGGRWVSLREVQNAAEFLKKRNGWTCKEHVSKIMGLCLDVRKRRDIKKFFARQKLHTNHLSHV
ncbi:MAG: hypothetical protein M1461_08575 [Nitrospirae bacterium]|nr:hypothetical protein [Nitrospirota bacterium]